MKSEEIEIKKLSVKQYLTMIIPELAELIKKIIITNLKFNYVWV